MRFSSIAAVVIITALPAAAAVRTPREIRQTASPSSPKSGVRAELLHDLDDMQKKIISLAMAVPAEKYAWRPVRGVRSVSEVYMHIAGGNYTLVSFVGDRPNRASTVPPGDGTPQQRMAARVKRLPIWIVHGEADSLVPVGESRLMAEALRAVDADVHYTELPGTDHDSWTSTYASESIVGWLFDQRRT